MALGLLALIATSFSLAVRSQLRSTASLAASARAEAFADAGVMLALRELLAAREDRTRPRRFPIDGRGIGCMLADTVALTVTVQDEAGRVDLNAADEAMLTALLRGVGLGADETVAITDRILDFRDRDSERRGAGAERPEYAAAGLPGPKDAAFDAVEELGQVLGLDAALASQIKPLVTVHSGLAGVDPKVASDALLAVLAGGYGAAGGARSVSPASGTAGTLPAPLVAISPQQIYAIRSDATTADGARFIRETIVDLGARRATSHVFKRWQRGSGGAPAAVSGALPPC